MTGTDTGEARRADPRTAVEDNPVWYHTIDVAPGVTTPGWFDLRGVVDQLPWPDVRGKRCLDVGTYDGFLAFELERRGASEVVATDISDHEHWDWPRTLRSRGPAYLRSIAGEHKRLGFETARDLLGSSVEKVDVSVYDLASSSLGRFDVVVCGALLLHLRDPVAAVEAIRGVCDGLLLSTNQVEVGLSLRAPRTPLARLDGMSDRLNWWLVNVAGHRRMLQSGGFEVERETGIFAVPFGVGHPASGKRWLGMRAFGARLVAGGHGVPHHAVLARPM